MAKKAPILPLGPLPDLLAWWQKARVKGVIIGGLAVAFRGKPRTTRDVDAIVFLDESRWERFLEKGKSLTFESRIPDALQFARENRVFLIRHGESGTDIDLSLGQVPFESETLARARKIKVGRVAVPVATAEDLIVLKAIANRPQDQVDIIGILERQGNKLDLKRTEREIDALAAMLDMPDVAREFRRMVVQHRNKGRRKKKTGGDIK